MLDQVKYEYITLDLPNIQVAWERGKDRAETKFYLDEPFKNFVIQAAMKFPMWRFMSGGDLGGMGLTRNPITRVPTDLKCYRLWVYDGSERLGSISYETRLTKTDMRYTVYILNNQRIAHKRERGDSDKTKDINKALKILAKSFGAKTISERMKEAFEQCEDRVGSITTQKATRFNDEYRSLVNGLRKHLMVDKWEEIKQIAMDSGVDLTVLDRLPNTYEDYKIAQEIDECVEHKKGVVVIIHGNDYAVQSFATANADPTIEMLSTETLPDWIKRGVGMLKLVEPHNMVGNVGYKISDGAFFVMKGDQ
jgi:predicted ribosome quality control (RQC) complex YloA/Tae2 family protein